MCTCLKLVNDAIAYPCMFLQLISLNNSLLLFSKTKNSAPVKKWFVLRQKYHTDNLQLLLLSFFFSWSFTLLIGDRLFRTLREHINFCDWRLLPFSVEKYCFEVFNSISVKPNM